MEWSVITTAMTNFTGVLSTIIETVAENAYLCVFLAVPVFKVGCAGFRKLIKIAR